MSCWLCTPYVEAESVDVALVLPMDIRHVCEVLLVSVDGRDKGWLNHAMATTPQVSEDYGSIMSC